MMHRLTRTERAAKHLRHDPDVLCDPAATFGVRVANLGASDPDVALRVNPSSFGAAWEPPRITEGLQLLAAMQLCPVPCTEAA